MTDEVTIKNLAAEIKTSVDRLVQQFADAGIQKSADDSVNAQEKQALLVHLNNKHNFNFNKLILKRKTRSILNVLCSGGKSKSIQIELRKKKTFMRNDLQELENFSSLEILKNNETKKNINNSGKEIYKNKNNENIEKGKHEVNKKGKFVNQQNSEINKIAQAEKIRLEKEAAKLKRKVEEEISRKLEEEARRVAEEARRMVEENKNNWNDMVDFSDDSNDYHTTTSKHARQAEDENDRKIENYRRRNTKIIRQKKSNKNLELKADSEESKNILYNNSKNIKRKISSLQQKFQKPVQTINRNIVIGETITVSELANKMAVKGSQVIKAIMKLGAMVTINQVIDQETAQLITEEMGHKVILRRENELEEIVMNDRDIGLLAEPRAPVVTIMGHVDHGKTSLLDYIRSTKIASKEEGGITQHIGAYNVKYENSLITFLDTPGHAAFTAMRARGIQTTDIVVLVIAADDGVMPQTIEAIQHIKAAQVPMIVAINKIDKVGNNLDRIKNDLSKYNIISEEWGGDYQFIYVSAKTGVGINELMNAIILQAEILELKAIRNGMARGAVIESFLDKGKGPIATVLIREGTLNKGDIILCGFEYGRVRFMRNQLGQEITEAGPSIPVEIVGLSGVPVAGDEITVVRDEKKAREVALYRQGKFREIKLARQQKIKLENKFSNLIEEGKLKQLNIVLKADVQGSVEVIYDALNKLSNNEIKINIIGSGVGGINENDATLAAASNAILIGFNVRADTVARNIINSENLDIRYYSIIYNLINDIKLAINGMLIPDLKQKIIGLAEVRNVFKSKKFSTIAGCIVIEGLIRRHNPIRVLRDNVVIYEGELESLRHFKNDVNEIHIGMECGVGIKNYNNISVGDTIEVFEIIKIKRNIN